MTEDGAEDGVAEGGGEKDDFAPLELVLVTDAATLGAAVLAFLVVEGVGLAVGLSLLAASHSGVPTMGAGFGGGTGKDFCGRGRHIGAPVLASEGTWQCVVLG
jgi:hypothetical protein